MYVLRSFLNTYVEGMKSGMILGYLLENILWGKLLYILEHIFQLLFGTKMIHIF